MMCCRSCLSVLRFVGQADRCHGCHAEHIAQVVRDFEKKQSKRKGKMPIHNCGNRQWDYLEMVDRVSGESERVRLDDEWAPDSVAIAAGQNAMTMETSWDVLLRGGTIPTSRFVLRLGKDEEQPDGTFS